MDPNDIVKKYLGIKYQHLGRDPQRGLDCWGLIKNIYADAGIQIEDLETYAVNWSHDGQDYFAANDHSGWERVDLPAFMDVVLFTNKEGIANHAGLVLDGNRFIHCCRAGVVVSRLCEFQWFQRTAGYFRLRKK